MVKQLFDVKSIVHDYAREVSKQIKVDRIFLFGSAARGEMNRDSDVDLIVISRDFHKMNFMKRLQLLSRASLRTANVVAMDVIGYTPAEFKAMDKVDSVMLKKMKHEGYFVR